MADLNGYFEVHVFKHGQETIIQSFCIENAFIDADVFKRLT